MIVGENRSKKRRKERGAAARRHCVKEQKKGEAGKGNLYGSKGNKTSIQARYERYRASSKSESVGGSRVSEKAAGYKGSDKKKESGEEGGLGSLEISS